MKGEENPRSRFAGWRNRPSLFSEKRFSGWGRFWGTSTFTKTKFPLETCHLRSRREQKRLGTGESQEDRIAHACGTNEPQVEKNRFWSTLLIIREYQGKSKGGRVKPVTKQKKALLWAIGEKRGLVAGRSKSGIGGDGSESRGPYIVSQPGGSGTMMGRGKRKILRKRTIAKCGPNLIQVWNGGSRTGKPTGCRERFGVVAGGDPRENWEA